MKVAILSGAYGNAGDFLIEKRSAGLVDHVFGEGTASVFSRKELGSKYDEINSCDIIAFSGGPIYQKNIGSNFNIVDAMRFTKPLIIIGGGWKGAGRWLSVPYDYAFSADTRALFDKINENQGLSCRDWYSVKALTNAGFDSAVMTGCPAWYDVSKVHNTVLEQKDAEVKSIFVSDPAIARNYELVIPLLQYLHSAFHNAVLTFVFHRAEVSDGEKELERKINSLGYVEVKRLSASADSFDIYRNCDLHIGFRVHAHIYCLSERQRTILIEEDGRGGGVNEALGLPGLLAYNDEYYVSPNRSFMKKVFNKVTGENVIKNNGHLTKQLDCYVSMMEISEGTYYENAFRMMEEYYQSMTRYLSLQKNIISRI